MRSWKVIGGLRLGQLFPSHVMHFILDVFMDPSLLEKAALDSIELVFVHVALKCF